MINKTRGSQQQRKTGKPPTIKAKINTVKHNAIILLKQQILTIKMAVVRNRINNFLVHHTTINTHQLLNNFTMFLFIHFGL